MLNNLIFSKIRTEGKHLTFPDAVYKGILMCLHEWVRSIKLTMFFLKDFSLKQQSYPWSPLEANH